MSRDTQGREDIRAQVGRGPVISVERRAQLIALRAEIQAVVSAPSSPERNQQVEALVQQVRAVPEITGLMNQRVAKAALSVPIKGSDFNIPTTKTMGPVEKWQRLGLIGVLIIAAWALSVVLGIIPPI